MADKKEKFIIEFTKEYEFDGKKIKTLNYSKAEDFSAKDFVELTDTHKQRAPKDASTPFLNTKTSTFALCVLQKSTGLPFEFFETLSMKDYMKATDEVTTFLLS